MKATALASSPLRPRPWLQPRLRLSLRPRFNRREVEIAATPPGASVRCRGDALTSISLSILLAVREPVICHGGSSS
jgi:hypothetical protein